MDNESLVKNSSTQDYILKKKHVSIYYHLVCEESAAGFLRIFHIKLEYNNSDFLARNLSGNKLGSDDKQILY